MSEPKHATAEAVPDITSDWLGDLTKWDRAVVVRRAGIIAGVGTALQIAAVLLHIWGVSIPDGLDDKVTLTVTSVLDAATLLAGLLAAIAKVTPADPALKPISTDGQPLLTVADAEAAVAVGRAASPVAATDALAAAQAIHPMTTPAAQS